MMFFLVVINALDCKDGDELKFSIVKEDGYLKVSIIVLDFLCYVKFWLLSLFYLEFTGVISSWELF